MSTAPPPAALGGTLAGFNVLLEGDAGTGKTYSIGTLVDTGINVSYLALESGIESLFGYWSDRGKPIPPNLSWHVLKSPEASIDQLIENATKVNTYSFEALTKMSDPSRNKYNQFISLLQVLNGFVDQRTGQNLGAVNKWTSDRCLVIDPLTGINRAAMDLVVGGKPVKAMNEWGIAQDQVEKVLRLLTSDCLCHFILIAHIEKEIDQIQGGTKITVSTLGKALAPKIPPMFSDVILSYREGREFFWSTANPSVALKTRNLPIADKIPPSFGQIVDKWTTRSKESAK
jgi:hypothetical protein